jgi:hypothetical protein
MLHWPQSAYPCCCRGFSRLCREKEKEKEKEEMGNGSVRIVGLAFVWKARKGNVYSDNNNNKSNNNN